jgi:hypothetical protein
MEKRVDPVVVLGLICLVAGFHVPTSTAQDIWMQGPVQRSDFAEFVPWGTVAETKEGDAQFYRIVDAIPLSHPRTIALLIHRLVQSQTDKESGRFEIDESMVVLLDVDHPRLDARLLRLSDKSFGLIRQIEPSNASTTGNVAVYTTSDPGRIFVDAGWLWDHDNRKMERLEFFPSRKGWSLDSICELHCGDELTPERSGFLRKLRGIPFATARGGIRKDCVRVASCFRRNGHVIFELSPDETISTSILVDGNTVLQQDPVGKPVSMESVSFPICPGGMQEVVPVAMRDNEGISIFRYGSDGRCERQTMTVDSNWRRAIIKDPLVTSHDGQIMALVVDGVIDRAHDSRSVLLVSRASQNWEMKQLTSIGKPFWIDDSIILSFGDAEIFSNSYTSGVSSYRVRWSFRDLMEKR